MAESLPLIPPNTYRYDNRAVFVTRDNKWFVWGPDYLLPEDSVVEVYRDKDDKMVPQYILKHVAYRLVRKHSGATVRFVLCTFDNVMNEAPFEEVNDDASTAGNARTD
jgi:hypothetical protein